MRAILKAFARNTVFANIIFIMIVVAGLIAATLMIREAFPEFSLEIIQVTVAYPGADPEEVEEGVCRKIEEAIDGLEGVKQYHTTAAENVGLASIEVHQSYDTEDVLKRVRSRIDAISTFPKDAEKPIVEEFLLRDRILFLTLAGDVSEYRLKEQAQDLKKEIARLPEVSQVELAGVREYEIGIEVSESRLRQYQLNLGQVADAVRRSNLNLAGGTLHTEGEEIRLRTIGRRYTGSELANIVVIARPGGESITLGRIATIRDGFTEDPLIMRVNGQRAVGLTVLKTKQQDALKISKAVTEFVTAKQEVLPAGVDLQVLYNITPNMLQARIDLLVKNGIMGLCIVFLLLWLFLDIRLSFWAGMGIPITIAGALVILWAIGGTINMISLFGLIMVLGIIVDDAIVVGEAIYVHRRRGKSPLQAAVDGVSEVALPVIGAVTTTIVAFLPLAYIGGIMGKFIRILPIVVIACLVISLIECLIILPAHLSHLPDPNADLKGRTPWLRRINALRRWTSGSLDWFVRRIYTPFLAGSMKWAYVSLAAAVMVFFLTIAFAAGGVLKFEVFPKIDGFVVASTVEFPAGTPPEVTADAVAKMEAAFRRVAARHHTASGKPLLENTLSLVGGTLDDIPKTGLQFGAIQAVLVPSEERSVHSDALLVEWQKELGEIPGAEAVTFQGMAAGMPGAPIEIWLQGENMDVVLAAVEATKARLSRYAGVYQVQSDFRPGKNEMQLKLKPEARGLGLTVSDLARQIHAGYYGDEAVRLQRGRDDVRVKVRYPAEDRRSRGAIDDIHIRTPSGEEVPLHSVADVTYTSGYSAITRTDGMRRVAVSAELDTTKANAAEIAADLQKNFFPGLEKEHAGVFVSLQGEDKNTRESFSSLAIGYPLAMLGILVIIATILRSYIQPLVIMFTVPFGIVGAFIGHLLLGYPLSMMSMFGIVALSGVVVNDAIVLIESINANLADGMPFLTAIKEGCVRRFRPVFLTSVSTVGGLMPMILEKDLQAKFLIPMALAIAAGVAFATVLTLVLIPSLLVIVNDGRRLVHRIRYGAWPTREEVEPAAKRNADDVNETELEGGLSHVYQAT